MHAMIAYGVDSELIAGDRRVNAIGYLCYNGVCNGQQLFYTSNGKLQTRIGPGVQGHPGQFLAMLAQSRVKTDFPILVEGQKFTVADLIQHEKDTCRPKTELTFKLIAFMHYLKSDDKWKSNDGQDWDIPRADQGRAGPADRRRGLRRHAPHDRLQLRRPQARAARTSRSPASGCGPRSSSTTFTTTPSACKTPTAASAPTGSPAGPTTARPAAAWKRPATSPSGSPISLDKEQLVEPRMIKSVSYLTNLLHEQPQREMGHRPARPRPARPGPLRRAHLWRQARHPRHRAGRSQEAAAHRAVTVGAPESA